VAKLASDGFDPKAFLAKVGAGKTILKLAKNKHVFEQGRRGGHGFLRSKRQGQAHCSPQSKVRKR